MNRNQSQTADRLARRSPVYASAAQELQSGNLSKARDLGATLAELFPDAAAVWSLRAAIAVAANDFRSALALIEVAARLDPDNSGIFAHKANTLAVLRKFPEAKSAAGKAFSLGPGNADTYATLGTAYTKISDFEQAQACFRKAVELAPDSAGHQYNLGTALRFAGDFAAAERCFDHTLERRPRDCETLYARSGLRSQTADNNHIAELKDHLEKGPLHWRDEMLICYALAKELEDLRQWDDSFAYLKRGADRRRKNMRYDVALDSDKMREIAAAIGSKQLSSNVTGYETRAPVFVLGLPRAGSTLVERILSSHSRVTSAGELQNFAIELMRPIYARAQTMQIPIEKLVAETLALDFTALGKAYVESAGYLVGESPHFVDKMPQNFLYTGLIQLALPTAKIIHVYRHPMDACYSMYKMIFKAAYPFSYNLDDLGRYYVAYHRLMQHWNDCLPGRILNIRYEDLIADQETETRKLLAYCELEWQDQCLSFHKLDQPVTTASAVEVRKPIYSSSVNKWKNYRRQLGELENYFREQDIGLQD